MPPGVPTIQYTHVNDLPQVWVHPQLVLGCPSHSHSHRCPHSLPHCDVPGVSDTGSICWTSSGPFQRLSPGGCVPIAADTGPHRWDSPRGTAPRSGPHTLSCKFCGNHAQHRGLPAFQCLQGKQTALEVLPFLSSSHLCFFSPKLQFQSFCVHHDLSL